MNIKIILDKKLFLLYNLINKSYQILNKYFK